MGFLYPFLDTLLDFSATIGQFKDVYDGLGRDANGIVSIRISSKISGTYNSEPRVCTAASESRVKKVPQAISKDVYSEDHETNS